MRTAAPPTETVPDGPPSHRRGPILFAWAGLLLVLGVGLPLFLCMPLNWDTVQYDLCARKVLRGGVMYRDAFDNNLPGVLWVQMAIRLVFGWRSEALRLADFGILGLAVLMLLRWLPAREAASPARLWTAAALAVFYLFSPEFIHCQRDCWMLLPAVAALCLRRRQLLFAAAAGPWAARFAPAVVEGLLWGAAFWIKPFVAVPALAVWSVGALVAPRGRGSALLDAGGLLVGGLLAGGLGLAWLAATGAWDSFWDVQLVWNCDYAVFVHLHESRPMALLTMIVYYLPWHLVHAAAVPVALIAVVRAVRGRGKVDAPSASRALLGAFYLSWLAQAAFLQRVTDYGVAACVFPAIVLVADSLQTECKPLLRIAVLATVVVATVCLAPGLNPRRLALWARCCREGSTPELRDRLGLPTWRNPIDWQDLARVAEFLRARGAADGEVTCLNGFTPPLYLDLNLEASTRYHGVAAMMTYFPSHGAQVRAELEASRSRFVVTDLTIASDLEEDEAKVADPNDPLALPPNFRATGGFPRDGRIVFRSGKYVVHSVQGVAGFFAADDARAANGVSLGQQSEGNDR